MPCQPMSGQGRAEALIQQAFLVVGYVAVVLCVDGTSEEAGWRHLLGVTGNDQLLSTGDRTYRIPGCDLRGFVEDNDVEEGSVGRQVLRNRKGTHQQAWS